LCYKIKYLLFIPPPILIPSDSNRSSFEISKAKVVKGSVTGATVTAVTLNAKIFV